MIKKPVIDTQDCLFSKNRFYSQLHLRWGVIFLFIVFIANFESRVWLNGNGTQLSQIAAGLFFWLLDLDLLCKLYPILRSPSASLVEVLPSLVPSYSSYMQPCAILQFLPSLVPCVIDYADTELAQSTTMRTRT